MIEYNLIRSRRKTLALMITKEGELEARAPLKLSLDVIEAFIQRKQNWIEQKIELINQRKVKPKEYMAGESFLYLGQSYELEISDAFSLPVVLTDKLYLATRHQHRAKKVLLDWFRREAQRVLSERVGYFTTITGCSPQTIKMSNAVQRWGSCSARGNVNFSWRLVMAPLDIIDYVIVHELVHMKQHDHSHKFWVLVEQIMPDYQERRKWLKVHGATLVL